MTRERRMGRANVRYPADRDDADDPERFSDPLQSFGHLARRTFRAFARSLEQRIVNHGVTIGQWRFLRESWLDNGVTQRELSARLNTREPSMVGAVRSLEAAGRVRRERDTGDRRKVRIHLARRGWRLREPLVGRVGDVNAAATAGVPREDLETTRRVLPQLIDNLGATGANDTLVDEAQA